MSTESAMLKDKRLIAFLWLSIIAGSLVLYFYFRPLWSENEGGLASAPIIWISVIYFVVGCLRGFTLMPATILIGMGMLFLRPFPLFVLTMLGTLISSAGIYYSSSLFELYEHFQKKNKRRLDAIESGMKEFELPIIIAWSFCPMLPTDIVCCVSGVLKLNLAKLLIGVFIGEGICSAIYIFGGMQLFRFFGLVQ